MVTAAEQTFVRTAEIVRDQFLDALDDVRLQEAPELQVVVREVVVPDAEQVDFYGYYNGQSYPIPRKATLGLNVTL